ncbi:DUF6515 family protein [Candidatus Omnitrophota bacterium]
MVTKKIIRTVVMSIVVCSFLSVYSVDAFASKKKSIRHRQHRHHHHPYRGKIVSLPELIAKVIIHAGVEYYYHHGYFYKRTPSGYIIVDAPRGAIVTALPKGHKTIVIKGNAYYYYNDIYYVRKKGRYIVIPDPVYEIVELPKEVKVIESNSKDSEDSYTVNIPNANGSYTAVTLNKLGDGFVGPQGEFYYEFPSVEQLKVMYGK